MSSILDPLGAAVIRLKQVLREVHERSIWQVLFIYVGGSWALLGHVDLMTARLGFPDWMFAFSIVLLAAGFIGLLAIRVWPKVRPSPVVRNVTVTAVVYVLVASSLLIVVGLTDSPRMWYGVVFWLFSALLPISMALAVRLSDHSRQLSSAARDAAWAGLGYFVLSMFGVEAIQNAAGYGLLPWFMLSWVPFLLPACLPIVVVLVFFWSRHRRVASTRE